ncbi:MAG: hypothetical protein EBU81_15375, partial [Proteobacteria bacterium]|nr:hypothetical protein [Pseudomonadota bacterium]
MSLVPEVVPWSGSVAVPSLGGPQAPQPAAAFGAGMPAAPMPSDRFVASAALPGAMNPAAAPLVPGSMDPQARPGAHTMNVIGAIAPLKMVPEMMNRAAASAVARSADAGLMLKASVDGLKGLKPTFGAALGQALNPMNLFRSLKFGALVSFPLAFIQNFLDMKNGQITTNQMLAGTVADGIGYT